MLHLRDHRARRHVPACSRPQSPCVVVGDCGTARVVTRCHVGPGVTRCCSGTFAALAPASFVGALRTTAGLTRCQTAHDRGRERTWLAQGPVRERAESCAQSSTPRTSFTMRSSRMFWRRSATTAIGARPLGLGARGGAKSKRRIRETKPAAGCRGSERRRCRAG